MSRTKAEELDLDAPLFADEDSPLLLEEEETVDGPSSAREPYRILVVDDDPEVIAVTRMALGDLRVDGTPVEIVAAQSAAEAREVVQRGLSFGLAILDVVMERPEAGLELARFLRNLPACACSRVVLRTGQPGVAPEEEVLRAYDINDYWPKTELTAHRMRTLVTGQLRSYRDILVIEHQRRDLLRVIEATELLFRPEGSRDLVDAILRQLANLLPSPATALAFLQGDNDQPASFRLLAATGPWRDWVGREVGDLLQGAQLSTFRNAVDSGRLSRHGVFSCFVFHGEPRIALMLDCAADISVWGEHAIELFCRNASSIFQNDSLLQEREVLLRAVERFVPSTLVKLLGVSDVRGLQRGDHVSLDLAVMFADLHGFTTTVEKLTPEAAFDLLEATLDALTPAVESQGGVIDKYLGDGFMALFPAESEPAAAVVAVHAALDELNARRIATGKEPLRLGIGMHHGPVVLGALGHASRLELTAISDTVNVAARVERLTRTFGCSVLATDAAIRRLSEQERRYIRHVGMISLKGRQGRTPVYHLYAAHPQAEALLAHRDSFEALIAASARNDADLAARVDAYLEGMPDDPAATFLLGLGGRR